MNQKLLTSNVQSTIGNISNPPFVPQSKGAGTLNDFIHLGINLFFTVAGIAFLFIILLSALNWILSGGDKEKVASARKRITYAVIGLAIMAFAFLIINILGLILGIPELKI